MISRCLTSLLLIFSLSSCFEVIEDVTINKDGSGTFKINANFSESSGKIKTCMLLDSMFGVAMPNQVMIEENFAKAISQLKNTAGITNIVTTQNFEDYLFSISYDFNNETTLNNSFLQIIQVFDKNGVLPYQPYSFNSKSFSRNHKKSLTQQQEEKLKKMFIEVLQSARYISVYRLPTKVTSTSNTSSKISKSKRVVINRMLVGDVLLQENSIKNTITFQ